MKRNRGWASYVILLAVLLTVVMMVSDSGLLSPKKDVTYAELWTMVDAGQVKSVAIQGTTLWGLKTDTEIADSRFPSREYDFVTTVTDIESFRQEAYKRQAKVLGVSPDSVGDGDLTFTIIPMAPESVSIWVTMIPTFLLIGAMVFVFFMMMRAQGGGNGKVMNFGKAHARVNDPSKNKVTFADVAGAE